MIVTIDGPSGAGKSTVARELARRLGFRFLDTGAMYRAVALAGLLKQVDFSDPEALARVARDAQIEATGERVLLDGQDVTDAIRTTEVTAATRNAADCAQVRDHLGEMQRRAAEGQDLVTDGRDQGTIVFPDAGCKVFLTASPEERAHRRQQDMQRRGEHHSFDEVLAQQNERDRADRNRRLAPLVPAADAVELSTDGLELDEVVFRLEALVLARRGR